MQRTTKEEKGRGRRRKQGKQEVGTKDGKENGRERETHTDRDIRNTKSSFFYQDPFQSFLLL